MENAAFLRDDRRRLIDPRPTRESNRATCSTRLRTLDQENREDDVAACWRERRSGVSRRDELGASRSGRKRRHHGGRERSGRWGGDALLLCRDQTMRLLELSVLAACRRFGPWRARRVVVATGAAGHLCAGALEGARKYVLVVALQFASVLFSISMNGQFGLVPIID